MKLLKRLQKEKKISPPSFLIDNLQYLTLMGSQAYGTNQQDSDIDYYGFCMPKKTHLFPQLEGIIFGYENPKKFDQWQEHHIRDGNIEYDFSIYNIARYFYLCQDGNPNIVDSLFVPNHCIACITQMAQIVRENRRLFLHIGLIHRLQGYAHSQWKKVKYRMCDGVEKISKYESKFDIEHGNTLEDIEYEMKVRGIGV